jgi:hypothetical protein
MQKLLAELSLGFWIDLLKHGNHRLWVERKLHTAFPNTRLTMKLIHQHLKAIQLLRNRISHHEPVLTSSNRFYNGDSLISLLEVLESVEWICPETAQWMRTQFRYAEAERIMRHVASMGISL